MACPQPALPLMSPLTIKFNCKLGCAGDGELHMAHNNSSFSLVVHGLLSDQDWESLTRPYHTLANLMPCNDYCVSIGSLD